MKRERKEGKDRGRDKRVRREERRVAMTVDVIFGEKKKSWSYFGIPPGEKMQTLRKIVKRKWREEQDHRIKKKERNSRYARKRPHFQPKRGKEGRLVVDVPP